MITPMVARIEPLPFDREGWLFELKWDVSLLKTPSALWVLKLSSDGTIFLESCVNSSFPSSIRFPAGFEQGPDCIWRSSLFVINLASSNGRFPRGPN